MTRLRAIGFASGSPLSQIVLSRIAQDHALAGIVLPPRPPGMLSALRGRLSVLRNPLSRLGVPFVTMEDVIGLRPDVIVVASFPRLLALPILDSARIGAFNIHMSLLPRHRGVDPVFWTYWHNDREAGVSTHWMTSKLDAGDMAMQHSVPLPRGLPSRALYMQLANISGRQISQVLELAATSEVPRQAPHEPDATYASRDDIAKARVPFAEWPAERVWHVLSGLGDQYHGLIDRAPGLRLDHGRATGYRNATDIQPGLVNKINSGYELHCLDGLVDLPPPLKSRFPT